MDVASTSGLRNARPPAKILGSSSPTHSRSPNWRVHSSGRVYGILGHYQSRKEYPDQLENRGNVDVAVRCAMWVFTIYGFYSIACASKPDGTLDPDTVMVLGTVEESRCPHL